MTIRRGVVRSLLVLAALAAGAARTPAQDAEPPAQQGDDTKDFEHDLVDILRERGLITEAQGEELIALARERADRDKRQVDLIEGHLEKLRAPEVHVKGGKPGDLEFRSADGKWSLGIEGRLQARFENLDSTNDAQSGKNFSIPRVRLTFDGRAGSENVRYRVEIDASTNDKLQNPPKSDNLQLKDAYVDWTYAREAALRFGQFRFPFGRETIPSGATSFPSTSIATQQFVPGREPGMMVHGRLDHDLWDYYYAISNGDGTGKNNTPGSTNNGLRYGARFVWNPLGPLKAEGPAFQTVDDGSTKFALGLDWMDNQDSTGVNTVTPGADTKTKDLECQLFTGPVSLLGEFFSRSSDHVVGANVDDRGSNVQLGCFLQPDKWELVARHSVINFDVQDDEAENAVGLNYYVDKHNGKWQLEFDKLSFSGNTPDDKRIRLQYQVIF